MAEPMDLDLPKRLGGPHSMLVTTTAPGRDPRRTPRDVPSSPLKASGPNALGLNAPTSQSNTPTGPMSTETPSSASFSNAPSILDIVNSSIQLKEHETERSRLEKEITSLTKRMQKASQSPQFSNTVTSYQCQLHKAKDELTELKNLISQKRTFLARAESRFSGVSSEPKPDSRIDMLTSELESMRKEARADASQIRETISQTEQKTRINNQEKVKDAIMGVLKNRDTEIQAIRNDLETLKARLQDQPSGIKKDTPSDAVLHGNLSQNMGNDAARLDPETEARRNALSERIAAEEEHIRGLKALRGAQQQIVPTGSRATRDMEESALTELRKVTQRHDGMLEGIQKIHSNAQETLSKRLEDMQVELHGLKTNMTKVENAQKSHFDLSEERDRTHAKAMESSQTEFAQNFGKLARQVDVNMANKAEVLNIQNQLNATAKGFEETKTTVDSLLHNMKKCEDLDLTHSRALRSLESRYTNLTTGDLVNAMAQEMQKMYPSMGQVRQEMGQSKKAFNELAQRVSISEKQGATKVDVSQMRANLAQIQLEHTAGMEAMRTIQKEQSDSKEQLEKAKALLEMNGSQNSNLAPDQLVALQGLSALTPKLHEMSEAYEKFTDLNAIIHRYDETLLRYDDTLHRNDHTLHEHGEDLKRHNETLSRHDDALRARLEESSTLENKFETMNGCIEELSENVDKLKGKNQDFSELGQMIGALEKRLDNPTCTTRHERLDADVKGLLDARTTQAESAAKLEKKIERLENMITCGDIQAHVTDRKNFEKIRKETDELKKKVESVEKVNHECNGFCNRLRMVEDGLEDLRKKMSAGGSAKPNTPISQRVEAPQSQLKKQQTLSKLIGSQGSQSSVPGGNLEPRQLALVKEKRSRESFGTDSGVSTPELNLASRPSTAPASPAFLSGIPATISSNKSQKDKQQRERERLSAERREKKKLQRKADKNATRPAAKRQKTG
ncbi:unnamed protein product [Penicillium olsonii]|nr:unnamed protein product [Penicillium olsonii]